MVTCHWVLIWYLSSYGNDRNLFVGAMKKREKKSRDYRHSGICVVMGILWKIANNDIGSVLRRKIWKPWESNYISIVTLRKLMKDALIMRVNENLIEAILEFRYWRKSAAHRKVDSKNKSHRPRDRPNE